MRWTASGGRCRGTEAAEAVDEIANGLLALGIAKGDAFALLGRTALEWALFDFALALIGAVGAPIYSSSSERDVRYVLEHSRSVGALVEDDEIRRQGRRLGVQHVISYAGLDELRASGRPTFAAANPDALRERADSIDEDDLFTFIYTSGTTGPPKACMIRHRNYYAMVQKSDEFEERLTLPGDVMLLYLPLAHNYGRLLHLSGAYIGFTIAFLPDPMRRLPNCSVCGRRCFRASRASTRRSMPRSPLGSRRRPAFAAGSSTGRFGSAVRCPFSGRPTSPCRPGSRGSTASPTGSSTRRSRNGSAAGCASRTPAALRSHVRSPSSSTRSTS